MTHLLPLLAAAAVGLCGAAGVVVTAARRPAADPKGPTAPSESAVRTPPR